MDKIKLAIIGYGAMSELYHVPAALKSEYVDLVGVYDINQERLIKVVKDKDIPNYGSDYRNDIDKYDAAIIAVPNHLHSKISIDLMRSGKHVLVEKPIALLYDDSLKMYEVSKKENVILSVGHVRKIYPESIFVKKLIASDALGKVSEIIINEGNVFSWPMASRSFLDKEVSGGGTLMDIGIHVIDLLAWWLKDLDLIEYYDDSIEGLESDSKIVLKSKKSTNININLSRQRKMSNTIKILFEKGILTLGTGINSKLSLEFNTEPGYSMYGKITTKKTYKSFEDIILDQIEKFIFSIKNRNNDEEAIISAIEALKIIEKCYKNKKDIFYKWETI
jgi:predicted dehydrogenase